MFNNFAACLYPDAVAFTEEFRAWSHASGPFYKIPDESKFANRIRDMLVLEDGDTFISPAACPVAGWNQLKLGAPTAFPRISATSVSISGPVRSRALWKPRCSFHRCVRRRPSGWWPWTPGRKIESVTIDGKSWTRINADLEADRVAPFDIEATAQDPLPVKTKAAREAGTQMRP